MDRKKPPALTSPWKVGFLVALMLVVTGLGVSYFITGTFGVSWHWIAVGGPSPTQWKFNLSAFASEMLPLIGLISILAFASSVLVSGAVRRYKTYVDSGAQYKDLLRSIKGLEDLEDDDKLDQLKQHPELREFLMGLKHRLAARERQGAERERKHPEAGSAPARMVGLASEASVLLGAITAGKDGFTRELALSIPELKQIERALRQRLADPAPARDEKAESVRRDLESKLGSLRGAVGAARRDADACSAGARELEAAVATLKQVLGAAAAGPASVGDAATLIKQVEALADSLSALGEDTKRIAIASALQASGGSDDDSIRVADEVRAIATRFNTLAQQWKESAPVLRRALDSASGSAATTARQREQVSKTVAAAASKVSLWSERLVVLAEQVRGLEQLMGAAGAASAPAAPESAREWGAVEFGAADEQPVRTTEPREAASTSTDDDFVTQSPAKVFTESASEDAPFADIPDFEKDRKFFVSPGNEADVDLESPGADGRFVMDGNNTDAEDWAAAPRQTAPAPAPAAEPEPAGEDGDGFLTGPHSRGPAKGKKASRLAPEPVEVEEPRASARAATMEEDPGAIDLYALGAVDYDERVHA